MADEESVLLQILLLFFLSYVTGNISMAANKNTDIAFPVDLRNFIATHLGNKFKQHGNDIFINIKLVDLHVKKSYLLDYGIGNTEGLVSLLKEMKSQKYINNVLNVLQLGLDIIILCPTVITELQNADLKRKYIFVDVTDGKGSPEVLHDIDDVCAQLSEVMGDIQPDFNSVTLIDVDCKNCNVSTLFGVFLGYPIVYWFDTTNEKMVNCLSREPLVSYKVVGQNQGCWWDKHCVVSFSIPQCLYDEYKSVVTKWFKEVYENCGWKSLFKELTMTQRNVQLDAVVL